MSDLTQLQFSLDAEFLNIKIADQEIRIDKGLHYIQLYSLHHAVLDSLVIEKMIDVIEGLLESTHLSYSVEKAATTTDSRMLLLSHLFFKSFTLIDRVMLENAFNDFIDHLEYYQKQVTSTQIDIFAYFVFIREMMHHLNIVTIQYLEH